MALLMISLGGAAGTLLRYGLSVGLARSLGAHFPFGTLAVNLVGSFLLAVVAEAFSGSTVAGVETRLVLGVGVLGGFTTYSSFNLELLRMLEQGLHGRCVLYLLVTVAGSALAGLLGFWVARAITAQ